MESYKIFIVEDDPWYGEMLGYQLALNPDYLVTRFTTGKECLANMHKLPDLVTLDFSLPDYTGDLLFNKIRQVNDSVPVVVISGQDDITIAIKMLKMGIADYFVKNDNTTQLLWNAVIKVRETSKLKKEVATLRQELGQKFSFNKNIKGQSPALNKIFVLMEKASKTNINVSITGETGTGKEVVAKGIHYNSERKGKPFVGVNMAAIPKELIESELFGHEKGAFTGAVARKAGKFEEANGGSIFLDEIAELDFSLQSKILRVLQEREIIRVGGNEKVKLEVRLIIASHKNLAEEVTKGNFREDLYYRIMGLPIELPPLRERGNDILILARHFADEFVKENKLSAILITGDAKEKLMRYNYPGNVRELKAIIDLAVVMSNGMEITADDISFSSARTEESFVNEEKTLRQYTCAIIRHFLKRYNDDIIMVADKLDIGKSTIYKMIQQKEIVV